MPSRHSERNLTEHLATAISESLLNLTYPRLFAQPRNGKSAVVTCVSNEYHQIGGKMVADIFELNGWRGHFLGANMPEADLKLRGPGELLGREQSGMPKFRFGNLVDDLDLIRQARELVARRQRFHDHGQPARRPGDMHLAMFQVQFFI